MAFNQALWAAYNTRGGQRVSMSLNQGELDRARGVCMALVERGQWDGFTRGVNIINPQFVYDRVVSMGGQLVEGEHYEFIEVNHELLKRTTPPTEQWRLPDLFPPFPTMTTAPDAPAPEDASAPDITLLREKFQQFAGGLTNMNDLADWIGFQVSAISRPPFETSAPDAPDAPAPSAPGTGLEGYCSQCYYPALLAEECQEVVCEMKPVGGGAPAPEDASAPDAPAWANEDFEDYDEDDYDEDEDDYDEDEDDYDEDEDDYDEDEDNGGDTPAPVAPHDRPMIVTADWSIGASRFMKQGYRLVSVTTVYNPDEDDPSRRVTHYYHLTL